jgi:mRNA-degrading endonuclease RelE of RelBE toxin-antitoxin system
LSYTILYNPSIRREMAKLSRAVLQRIDGAILALADDARPPGSAKLSGHDL